MAEKRKTDVDRLLFISKLKKIALSKKGAISLLIVIFFLINRPFYLGKTLECISYVSSTFEKRKEDKDVGTLYTTYGTEVKTARNI